MSIVSNRGATFTSVFWQELHKALYKIGLRGYTLDVCEGFLWSMGHTLAID